MTQGSQRKSRAIEALSSLRQAASSLNSAASSAKTPFELQRIAKLTAQLKDSLRSAAIEKALATASDKQVAAVGAFLSGDYDTIALLGGNRSGKSYVGAMITAMAVRDVLKPGCNVWVVAPNSEVSRGTAQKYLWELLPHGLLTKSWSPDYGFGKEQPMFTFDPDGRNVNVFFKSEQQYLNDPDSFEAATVDGMVWIDEAIDEKCWNAIQPRVAIHNVPVVVTTIPRMEWMFDAFEEAGPEARVYYDKLLPMDNPAMTPEAYKRLENSIRSEEERAMRLFGNFIAFSGIVYTEFVRDYKPDGHLVRPFKIPPHWPKWRTLDVGMQHPTVCLWCAVSPNGNKYVYREYRSRNTPIVRDAERILAASENEEYAAPTLIDSTAYHVTKANERSVARQFEDAGIACRPAVRVGRNIGEWPLVQNVKRDLVNQKLFVFDTCEGLVSEFRKWRYKRDMMGEPTGDSFVDRDNDALDALKYWVATAPSFEPPRVDIEYDSDW